MGWGSVKFDKVIGLYSEYANYYGDSGGDKERDAHFKYTSKGSLLDTKSFVLFDL